MIEVLTQIIVFAMLVEAITNIIKSIYKKGEGIQVPVIVSLVVAIALSIIYKQDLFAAFGFDATIQLVGSVLTGIIFSRGANIVSDLIYRLQNPTVKKEEVEHDGL